MKFDNNILLEQIILENLFEQGGTEKYKLTGWESTQLLNKQKKYADVYNVNYIDIQGFTIFQKNRTMQQNIASIKDNETYGTSGEYADGTYVYIATVPFTDRKIDVIIIPAAESILAAYNTLITQQKQLQADIAYYAENGTRDVDAQTIQSYEQQNAALQQGWQSYVQTFETVQVAVKTKSGMRPRSNEFVIGSSLFMTKQSYDERIKEIELLEQDIKTLLSKIQVAIVNRLKPIDAEDKVVAMSDLTDEDGTLKLNDELFNGTAYTRGEHGTIIRKTNVKNGKREGIETDYYSNETKKAVRNYVDGILQGEEIEYYASGQEEFIRNYVDGKREGEEIEYHSDGTVFKKRYYVNDKKEGEEIGFNKNGSVYRKTNYVNGIERKTQWWDDDGSGNIQFYNANEKLSGPIAMVDAQGNVKLEYSKYYISGKEFLKKDDGTWSDAVYLDMLANAKEAVDSDDYKARITLDPTTKELRFLQKKGATEAENKYEKIILNPADNKFYFQRADGKTKPLTILNKL